MLYTYSQYLSLRWSSGPELLEPVLCPRTMFVAMSLCEMDSSGYVCRFGVAVDKRRSMLEESRQCLLATAR